jgi:hypothetical protein
VDSANALFELTPDKWKVWRKAIQVSNYSDYEMEVDSEIFSILSNVRCVMELNCCGVVERSGESENWKCKVRFVCTETIPATGEGWSLAFVEERYLDTSTGIQVAK